MKTRATPSEVYKFLSDRRGQKFTVVQIAKEGKWTVSNVTQAVSRIGNIKVDSKKQDGNCGSRFVYYVDPVDFVVDNAFKPLKITPEMRIALERVKELHPEHVVHKSVGGA